MIKSLLATFLILLVFCGFGYAQDASDSRPESPEINIRDISNLNRIELYPNPVKDYLNITIENSTYKVVEIELYNIIGNNLSVNVEETGKDEYRLDLKGLNPGYYLIVIKDPLTHKNKSFKFQKS